MCPGQSQPGRPGALPGSTGLQLATLLGQGPSCLQPRGIAALSSPQCTHPALTPTQSREPSASRFSMSLLLSQPTIPKRETSNCRKQEGGNVGNGRPTNAETNAAARVCFCALWLWCWRPAPGCPQLRRPPAGTRAQRLVQLSEPHFSHHTGITGAISFRVWRTKDNIHRAIGNRSGRRLRPSSGTAAAMKEGSRLSCGVPGPYPGQAPM